MAKLSPGKARGLDRLSDGAGRYGLLAIDQRPPIFEIAARAAPGRRLPARELVRRTAEIKALLAETLAPEVTGLLVDPLYGFKAALPFVPRATGLMLTLEHHAFKTDRAGFRTSALIPKWDVDKAVRAGAESLKLLAWYRPDASASARARQEVFVRAAGAACAKAQRPFIFEILTYPLPGESAEDYARKLPRLLLDSVRAFAHPRFGVDLYKLPVPADAAGIREWGGALYGLDEIQATMARITRMLPAPWLLLSGGVSAERFPEVLSAAIAAGCRGYLAGRAVWLGPLQSYPDVAAVRRRLIEEGRAAIARLNGILGQLPVARPDTDWRLAVSL